MHVTRISPLIIADFEDRRGPHAKETRQPREIGGGRKEWKEYSPASPAFWPNESHLGTSDLRHCNKLTLRH